jgi:hypothetical protein
MSASLFAVVVDCRDARAQAEFWSEVLNRDLAERNTDEFVVNDRTGSATPLYFMKVPEPMTGKNRLHVDVITEGSLDEEVLRLTGLGAHLVEVREDPPPLENPDTWAVMQDPEGHVFCVTSTATITGWPGSARD